MKKIALKDIRRAAKVLADGGTVVFPTETLYGLAASALDEHAVRKVYAIKHRPKERLLPVIVGSFAQAQKYFAFSRTELLLAERFWPGPLSLVLKTRSRKIVAAVGGDRVAVRWSANVVAARLAILARVPIIATSANLSGELGCFIVRSVKRQFGHATDAAAGPDIYLDGGTLARSLPSTIVRVRRGRIEIIREGKISKEALGKTGTII
jgi:L-threonylcarbamoyladenylate synthase